MADQFVIVDSAFGRQEAEIVQSYLRARGIPCEVSQEAAGYVIGITVDGLGEAQILVPARYREEALEALREYRGRSAPEADKEENGSGGQ
ncbi:MAG: DUF2007 domain-containing protein [Anaerolineales bacterium]|nr:DUF2007 domain-containing protein [Anaerolineales bacterium]